MADFTRRRWTRPRIVPPRRPVDEEINPSSGWTNDFPGFHCLLVDIPGFEKDDIKLNVNESGIIEVSGRRKVDDEKQEHFKKTFNMPEDGDVKNGEMIFDGGTLRVRIPKVPRKETIKPTSTDGASTNNINTDKDKDKDINNSAIVPSESPASNNKTEKGMDDEPVESQTKAESPASSNGTEEPEIEEADKSLAPASDINNKSLASAGDINEQKTTPTTGSKEKTKDVRSESPKEEVNTKEPDEKQGKTEKPKEKEQKDSDQGPSSGQEDKSSKTSVLVKIAENKGILLASIISFTLGVLLSHKMHPSPN